MKILGGMKMQVVDESVIYEDETDLKVKKYLMFYLGEEIYGIPIESVTEIIELPEITKIPDMPEYVCGVINLRGKVIPVLDLRLRFGLSERQYDDRTCIINVSLKETNVGLIVDTVSEVVELQDKDIEPAPNFKSETKNQKFISGIGKDGEDVKILIDVEKIILINDLEEIKINLE